jgi:hypothetical protein
MEQSHRKYLHALPTITTIIMKKCYMDGDGKVFQKYNQNNVEKHKRLYPIEDLLTYIAAWVSDNGDNATYEALVEHMTSEFALDEKLLSFMIDDGSEPDKTIEDSSETFENFTINLVFDEANDVAVSHDEDLNNRDTNMIDDVSIEKNPQVRPTIPIKRPRMQGHEKTREIAGDSIAGTGHAVASAFDGSTVNQVQYHGEHIIFNNYNLQGPAFDQESWHAKYNQQLLAFIRENGLEPPAPPPIVSQNFTGGRSTPLHSNGSRDLLQEEQGHNRGNSSASFVGTIDLSGLSLSGINSSSVSGLLRTFDPQHSQEHTDADLYLQPLPVVPLARASSAGSNLTMSIMSEENRSHASH